LLAKEACLFEAIFININKNNNKNEARAKVKKQNNWRPLPLRGSRGKGKKNIHKNCLFEAEQEAAPLATQRLRREQIIIIIKEYV
jgi:hypothetical protein